MIDLNVLAKEEDSVRALCDSLIEGIETATEEGGTAQWRTHFRTSMPMCIG